MVSCSLLSLYIPYVGTFHATLKDVLILHGLSGNQCKIEKGTSSTRKETTRKHQAEHAIVLSKIQK